MHQVSTHPCNVERRIVFFKDPWTHRYLTCSKAVVFWVAFDDCTPTKPIVNIGSNNQIKPKVSEEDEEEPSLKRGGGST